MDTSYHFLSEGASNHEKDSTDGGNKLQEDLRLTNKNRWKIQICVLGGEKSGRTSMLQEFDKHYSEQGENLEEIVHCDFVTKVLQVPYADQVLKVKLWDSANKENAVPKKIMRRAHGFIVMVDVSNPAWE